MPGADALPRACGTPFRQVYATTADFEGSRGKFHIAVLRDHLHTFVVFADIPCGGTLRCATVRDALLDQIVETDIVDMARERVLFGETPWLIYGAWPKWRAIRRIKLSGDGEAASEAGWFPREIAEPILRMLERSVPGQTLNREPRSGL